MIELGGAMLSELGSAILIRLGGTLLFNTLLVGGCAPNAEHTSSLRVEETPQAFECQRIENQAPPDATAAVLIPDLSELPSAITDSTGVWGGVARKIVDLVAGGPGRVYMLEKTPVYIFPALQEDVITRSNKGVVTEVKAQCIAQSETNEAGYFFFKLEPGEYSLVFSDDGQKYGSDSGIHLRGSPVPFNYFSAVTVYSAPPSVRHLVRVQVAL